MKLKLLMMTLLLLAPTWAEPDHRMLLKVSKPAYLQSTVAVLRKRMHKLNVQVIRQDPDRIEVKYTLAADEREILELVNRPGKLEFREQNKQGKWVQAMDGSGVISADCSYDEPAHSWNVLFRLNPASTQRLAVLTARLTGKQMAIYLDGQQKLVATVMEAIRGGEVRVNFPDIEKGAQVEATIIADCLNGGALPAPIRILEKR